MVPPRVGLVAPSSAHQNLTGASILRAIRARAHAIMGPSGPSGNAGSQRPMPAAGGVGEATGCGARSAAGRARSCGGCVAACSSHKQAHTLPWRLTKECVGHAVRGVALLRQARHHEHAAAALGLRLQLHARAAHLPDLRDVAAALAEHRAHLTAWQGLGSACQPGEHVSRARISRAQVRSCSRWPPFPPRPSALHARPHLRVAQVVGVAAVGALRRRQRHGPWPAARRRHE